MAKTYMMGDGNASEEEKKASKDFTENQDREAKETLEKQIANESVKLKVTLEQLLQTKISPEEDRVIIWPDPVATVTDSGIIKPDETIKKEESAVSMGTVLAVGPGKRTQAGLTNRLLLSIFTYQKVEENLVTAQALTCSQFQREVDDFDRITLIPGDRVIFGKYAGTKVPDPVTKAEVLIMRPSDIFGKIRP